METGKYSLLGRFEIEDKEIISPFSEKVREVDGEKIFSYGAEPSGYTIRLGSSFLSPLGEGSAGLHGRRLISRLDPKAENGHMRKFDKEKPFWLPPHSYVLGVSLEAFSMPPDVIGLCFGKSSYARAGIVVNVTPLDAGWNGVLTMNVVNTAPHAVRMYPGEGIAQIVFFRGDGFGSGYDGSYQGANGIQQGISGSG